MFKITITIIFNQNDILIKTEKTTTLSGSLYNFLHNKETQKKIVSLCDKKSAINIILDRSYCRQVRIKKLHIFTLYNYILNNNLLPKLLQLFQDNGLSIESYKIKGTLRKHALKKTQVFNACFMGALAGSFLFISAASHSCRSSAAEVTKYATHARNIVKTQSRQWVIFEENMENIKKYQKNQSPDLSLVLHNILQWPLVLTNLEMEENVIVLAGYLTYENSPIISECLSTQFNHWQINTDISQINTNLFYLKVRLNYEKI